MCTTCVESNGPPTPPSPPPAPPKNLKFSTNSYLEDSIKGPERALRRTGDQLTLDGPAIRIPNNFKLFLSNDRNDE